MTVIQVPSNCVSVTTAAQGLITASGSTITVTSTVEAGIITSPFGIGPGNVCVQSTNSGGSVNLLMPSVVTAININGTNYTVASGLISNVPALDATNFIVGLF